MSVAWQRVKGHAKSCLASAHFHSCVHSSRKPGLTSSFKGSISAHIHCTLTCLHVKLGYFFKGRTLTWWVEEHK